MEQNLPTTPLGPEVLVYGLAAAVDPQLSPDGSRIVYAVARGNRAKPAERPTTQLWTCALDGSGAAPLTDSGQHHDGARWSPDGRRLAFIDTGPEGSQLRTVADAGGSQETLATHPLEIDGLAWSPTGDRLAYAALVDPDDPTAGPDALVRVTRRLDYKEDGRGYLGDRRLQVYVVGLDGGEPRQLTDKPLDHRSATWSPDGRRLAIQIAEKAGLHSWLHLREVDGTESADLDFGDRATVEGFSWSPSGNRLLVAVDPTGTSQPDLYLVDVSTGTTSRLTDDLSVVPSAGRGAALTPFWLDEDSVIFPAVRHGTSNLYRFDLTTRDLEVLTDWHATHAGFSVDRAAAHVVLQRSAAGSSGEVVVWDRVAGTTSTVTQINEQVFTSHPPADCERLHLDRAGFTIESWLWFPPDFDPTRRYPLILDVHGGPHGFHGATFSPEIQLLATHGYLVLATNPRGSCGYGRAFASAVVGDWGGEDYRDLEASVDLVAARPYVDGERLGIYGYSYGGFMTSWVLGQTDRYRAAVCGAPCYDLVSDYGTSDISPFSDPIEFGMLPWEDPEWYRERSPLTRAHLAVTPTLILHGEADTRCPIGQGEQMFTSLVQAGCDTEFVRYPGAAHLFPWTGAVGQRADFLARLVDWFGRHLCVGEGSF